MVHARIISVENPTTNHPEAELTSHLHRKFVKRRQHVETVLLPLVKCLGFASAEIFPAITSADFSTENSSLLFKGEHLKKGVSSNTGCDLSHYDLHNLCLAINDTLLILEDDALMPVNHLSNTLAAIRHYDSLPDNGDILYLQSQIPYLENARHTFPEKTHVYRDGPLIKVSSCSDMSGTTAYCIKPIAARNLVERAHTCGIESADGNIHHAFRENRIGVLIQKDFTMGFMLNEHWADWNH
jgi:GR25 family glycosyltransferase involved in LPS biosynthesis